MEECSLRESPAFPNQMGMASDRLLKLIIEFLKIHGVRYENLINEYSV